MPRNSRQHSDTGVYHVMLRGIDRHDIFADDQDRGKFLNVLRAVAAPKDNDGNPLPPYCRIHAYCLMDNHVHLLIAEGERGHRHGDETHRCLLCQLLQQAA